MLSICYTLRLNWWAKLQYYPLRNFTVKKNIRLVIFGNNDW